MIKVEKDIKNIPASLLQKVPKIDDEVKLELKKLYNNKCCYCEDANIVGEIEHYRPKSRYEWLEFDWENLLFACGNCNKNKWASFEISGTMANKNDSFEICDQKELPLMVNPEKDLAEQWIVFEKNGNIKSENKRMAYSIETCKLNRQNLNEKRKNIYDKLIRDIEISLLLYGDAVKIKEEILKRFIEPIKNNKQLSFIAFRKYIIDNWLNDFLEIYQNKVH